MVTGFSLRGRALVHAALGDPGRLAIVDRLALGDASPSELGEALGQASNLIAHHLKVLEAAGLVDRVRSEGDQRRTYRRLVPQTLLRLHAADPLTAARVVFVCTHNSARSQLAAALWARHSTVRATSAGTRPADRVHPRAVAAADRHGLSLQSARPTHVSDVLGERDLVISVCDQAHEQLDPTISTRLHWSVPDPARPDTDEAFESAYLDLADRIDRLAPHVREGA